MNRWWNRIHIYYGGYLGVSDDLINFWEEFIRNKMVDKGHLKKASQ